MLVTGAAGAAEASSSLFAEGERAFAAADYARALELFAAARDAGAQGPSVHYNIGVCEYRLGAYEAAAATFDALARQYPTFRELGEYNRGLALLGAGHNDAARESFALAERSADQKIAALARVELDKLGAPPRARTASWQAYAEAQVGHDDNVALIDELALPPDRAASSSLAELFGVATRTFSRAPLRFDANAYAVRYSDAGEYDQSALRLNASGFWSIGAWAVTAGPGYGRSVLDGDGFERQLGATARARRALNAAWTLETRLVYDDLDASSDRFAFIAGTREQLRLGLEHRRGAARVRVLVDEERNDRADPGVSPERRRWSVSYRRALRASWLIDGTIAWRESRYRDASDRREEDLSEALVVAYKELPIGWTLSVEGRFADNDSSSPVFSYESRRLAIALGRSFDWRGD
jgi:tetratricopeptide (TPR) repeat protein